MAESIEVGAVYKKSISYTQKQVEEFAQITGDKNPLHLDEVYAAKTPFKRPIIHGILSASIFSKMLGVDFPGEGTVYLKQEVEFLRPMYVETPYTARLEVLGINEKRHQATFSTVIVDGNTGKQTLRGKAVIMHKEKIG